MNSACQLTTIRLGLDPTDDQADRWSSSPPLSQPVSMAKIQALEPKLYNNQREQRSSHLHYASYIQAVAPGQQLFRAPIRTPRRPPWLPPQYPLYLSNNYIISLSRPKYYNIILIYHWSGARWFILVYFGRRITRGEIGGWNSRFAGLIRAPRELCGVIRL